MVVGEVLSETALPRMLSDDVLGRAYGLALPASLGGIVAGSLAEGIGPVASRRAVTVLGYVALVALGVFLTAYRSSVLA